MKKEEYMGRLAQALKDYDDMFVKEILNDYEEHFSMGLKCGQSEEEICRELGDIASLAAEIMEMAGPEKKKAAVASVKAAVTEPSGSFEYGGAEAEEPYKKPFALKKVCFSSMAWDVKVVPSPDGVLRVYFEDGSEESGNLCIIGQVREDTYYGKISSQNSLRNLFGLLNFNSDDVIIEVPSSVETLEIKSASGDITANGLNTKSIVLKTLSGDVQAERIVSNEVVFSTKSGDVEAARIFGEKAEFGTISGDVNIKTIRGYQITGKSTSGDVALTIDCQGKPFVVEGKSVSGTVRTSGNSDLLELLSKGSHPDSLIQVKASTISGDIDIKGK